MITGFNPADMYARRSHPARAARRSPACSPASASSRIHKEFVSAKIAGETASLTNPALDRILDFAAEAGLVVILHNDIDMPFAKAGRRAGVPDADARRCSSATRRRRSSGPTPASAASSIRCRCRRKRPSAARRTSRSSRRCSTDPALSHVNFDISWDEVAKYAVAIAGVDRARGRRCSTAIPTASCSAPTRWRRPARRRTSRCSTCGRRSGAQLTPEASQKVRKGNYERLFDEGAATGARLGEGERAMT